jgi:Mn2+/Fe2+ NRAMP family transporter
MLFYPYQVKAAGFKKEDLPVMRWDNIMFLGVAFSLISVSVLLAGSALHAPGAAPVQNAIQAANALAPIGGSAAKWLFSLGFFAVVWSTAVSPCFGTGYYVADLLNFKTKGDEEKALIDGDIHSDTRFKILSGLTMVSWLLGPLVAKVVAPFIVIMIAMGILNLFTPFIIASLFYISTSKKIMGKYAIGWFHRLTIAVGFAFSIVGVWSFISFLKSTFF